MARVPLSLLVHLSDCKTRPLVPKNKWPDCQNEIQHKNQNQYLKFKIGLAANYDKLSLKLLTYNPIEISGLVANPIQYEYMTW